MAARWRVRHGAAADILSEPDTAARSRRPSEPGWRNWQTQRTQNPPIARSWGFDPPSRHQDKNVYSNGLATQICGLILPLSPGDFRQDNVKLTAASAKNERKSSTDRRHMLASQNGKGTRSRCAPRTSPGLHDQQPVSA